MKRVLFHQAAPENGFTLIELLVVILIIGVLAAIAIPVFLNQRKAAVDASLESDLKNVATWYQSWRVDPAHTNTAFRAATGTVQLPIDSTGTRIEDSGLPPVRTTPGNNIRITVVNAPYSPHWTEVHEEGEFCLAGSSVGGNYDFSGGAVNHHKQLYYDSRLGGVKTVEELSASRAAGETLSCYAFVRLWDTATAG